MGVAWKGLLSYGPAALEKSSKDDNSRALDKRAFLIFFLISHQNHML